MVMLHSAPLATYFPSCQVPLRVLEGSSFATQSPQFGPLFHVHPGPSWYSAWLSSIVKFHIAPDADGIKRASKHNMRQVMMSVAPQRLGERERNGDGTEKESGREKTKVVTWSSLLSTRSPRQKRGAPKCMVTKNIWPLSDANHKIVGDHRSTSPAERRGQSHWLPIPLSSIDPHTKGVYPTTRQE